jgi:DnaJ-class molecular chaperone
MKKTTEQVPYKCPVCDGRGIIEKPPIPTTSTAPWPCFSCKGMGIVYTEKVTTEE